MPLRPSPQARVLAALLVAAGVLTAVLLGPHARPKGLVGELARAARGQGAPGMRVSIVSAFRACDAAAGQDIPALVCGAAEGVPPKATLSLIRRAADAARTRRPCTRPPSPSCSFPEAGEITWTGPSPTCSPRHG